MPPRQVTINKKEGYDVIRESSKGNSYTLSQLTHSTIILLERTEQNTIDECIDCKIYSGPCSGTIHIENCHQSVFTIACRRIVLKNCSDCTFYVYCTAPITMSHCTYIRFAEFNAQHPKLPSLMKAAGFSQDKNRWRDVKDTTEIQYGTAHQFLENPKFSLLTRDSGQLSEYAKEKIRQVFRLFDDDHDGVWAVREFNSFLKSIGSEERVTHEDHMRHLLLDIGIDIGVKSTISLENIFTLYESQGAEEVEKDFKMIRIPMDTMSEWELGVDHELPATSPCHINTTSFEDLPSIDDNYEVDLLDASDTIDSVELEIQKRLQKLGLDEQPEELTMVEEIQDEIIVEETIPVMEEAEDEPPVPPPRPQNPPTNALETIRVLIHSAKKRGVNVPLWFHYFDRSSKGRLSIEAFERALTGVGLGMGFGMGQEAQLPIEKALEPKVLKEVANKYIDPNFDTVDYQKFLKDLGFEMDEEEDPTPASPPVPAKQKHPIEQPKRKTPKEKQQQSPPAPKSAPVERTKKKKENIAKQATSKSPARKKVVKSMSLDKSRDEHTLPSHLSMKELVDVFQKLVKTSPDKYMCIWKGLFLHIEEDQLEKPLVITERQLHVMLHQVGFKLDVNQMYRFGSYIQSESWLHPDKLDEVNQPLDPHEFDTLRGEAQQVLSPTSRDDSTAGTVSSVLSFPAALLRDFLRHLRLTHLQSHAEWRKRKGILRKRDEERRIAIFQRALEGEKHSLSSKEIENLVVSAYSFDAEVLKIEATREATHWIDLQEGRAVMFKQVRKAVAPGDPREKKIQKKMRHQILQDRISFILNTPEEFIKLKCSLFHAYSRECTASGHSQSFTSWLSKRASNYIEQQRQVSEWNTTKKKQRMEAERWAKDVAPTHQVQKIIETAYASSAARGLDVNQKLKQIRSTSTHYDGSEGIPSPRSASGGENAWWNRLSTQNVRNSVDGTGGVISREACLAAISDIIPSLKPSDQSIKSLFSDPETVRNRLNLKLNTERGQDDLHDVIGKLKHDPAYKNKTDKQLEHEATRLLMEGELRGSLFSKDNKKIAQGAKREFDDKLSNVKTCIEGWLETKERVRKEALLKQQKDKKKKQQEKRQRQNQSKEAYSRWENSTLKKKYYSYKQKGFVARPKTVATSPVDKEWVDILDSAQVSNYEAAKLEEEVTRMCSSTL